MLTGSEEGRGTSGAEGSGEPDPDQREKHPSNPGHELVPQKRLERALALADDLESLKQLSDNVAVAQELARRMDLALEEQNRLAETRIRVARKLGLILRESVRRGGKSKSHDVTSTWGGSSSPLPEGITRMQSSRLQRIANIPEEDFVRYLQDARKRRESITSAGLLRFFRRRPAAGPGQVRSHGAAAEVYWEEVWNGVTRVMDLDLCVGVSAKKLGSPKFLPLKRGLQSQLSGNVLVRTMRDVAPWLKKLAQGRQLGKIAEAMILFVPHTGRAWFRLVESGGWTCCFLQKPESFFATHALAYLGERHHAFWLVFREFGAVLRAPES